MSWLLPNRNTSIPAHITQNSEPKEGAMDPIFDRLGNLIRSMFQDSDNDSSDPDLQDAWEELDDFLKKDPGTKAGRRNYSSSHRSSAPLELKKDYELLEVSFGAPFPEVKKAYKKMMSRYHPDKHSASQESLNRATDLSQKINGAYRRIEKYEEKGRL